jgi:hypothetical protein
MTYSGYLEGDVEGRTLKVTNSGKAAAKKPLDPTWV